MVGTSQDSLSLVFAALADPTRRAILSRLAEGDASVGELAGPLPMTIQAVSKHLKVLERAGLVTRSQQAQWRPVRLAREPLVEASEWIAEHKRLRSDQLTRIEETLRELQKEQR